VTDLFLTGVAFDFCVGYSALHAQEEGFHTTVIKDATKGTALGLKNKEGIDTNVAMEADLLAKGVKIVTSADLIDKIPFFSKPLAPATA
jgi:nicotinamidase/pyrazinamidase